MDTPNIEQCQIHNHTYRLGASPNSLVFLSVQQNWTHHELLADDDMRTARRKLVQT